MHNNDKQSEKSSLSGYKQQRPKSSILYSRGAYAKRSNHKNITNNVQMNNK